MVDSKKEKQLYAHHKKTQSPSWFHIRLCGTKEPLTTMRPLTLYGNQQNSENGN